MRIVDKNVKNPYMGHEFFVSSPVVTPVMRRWGIVGHYIDRCITPWNPTHADECRRMQNFSAAFFVQTVVCLGLESLSLPVNPYPLLVAFQDPEIQLALNRLFRKPRPQTYSAQN